MAGMVFDTTSSNTGAVSAGCISIQVAVERDLLWFACRHHVGEVVLTHMWRDLKVETSKKPEVQIFARFKENFEVLQHSSVEDLSFPNIPAELTSKREDLINICESAKVKSFACGDYRELVDLVLLLVHHNTESFTGFLRPGAMHTARWMAKLIYSFKIVLLKEKILELPK